MRVNIAPTKRPIALAHNWLDRAVPQRDWRENELNPPAHKIRSFSDSSRRKPRGPQGGMGLRNRIRAEVKDARSQHGARTALHNAID